MRMRLVLDVMARDLKMLLKKKHEGLQGPWCLAAQMNRAGFTRMLYSL